MLRFVYFQGALRRALADAPDALVEPVVNLVAAADQVKNLIPAPDFKILLAL